MTWRRTKKMLRSGRLSRKFGLVARACTEAVKAQHNIIAALANLAGSKVER